MVGTCVFVACMAGFLLLCIGLEITSYTAEQEREDRHLDALMQLARFEPTRDTEPLVALYSNPAGHAPPPTEGFPGDR